MEIDLVLKSCIVSEKVDPKKILHTKESKGLLIDIFEKLMDTESGYPLAEKEITTFRLIDLKDRTLFIFSGATRQICAMEFLKKLTEIDIYLIDDIHKEYLHGKKLGKPGSEKKHEKNKILFLLMARVASYLWFYTGMNHVEFIDLLKIKLNKIKEYKYSHQSLKNFIDCIENIDPNSFFPMKTTELVNGKFVPTDNRKNFELLIGMIVKSDSEEHSIELMKYYLDNYTNYKNDSVLRDLVKKLAINLKPQSTKIGHTRYFVD